MTDSKKEANEKKIKALREKEYKKRQSREKDIKRERAEGFEKKVAAD